MKSQRLCDVRGSKVTGPITRGACRQVGTVRELAGPARWRSRSPRRCRGQQRGWGCRCTRNRVCSAQEVRRDVPLLVSTGNRCRQTLPPLVQVAKCSAGSWSTTTDLRPGHESPKHHRQPPDHPTPTHCQTAFNLRSAAPGQIDFSESLHHDTGDRYRCRRPVRSWPRPPQPTNRPAKRCACAAYRYPTTLPYISCKG